VGSNVASFFPNPTQRPFFFLHPSLSMELTARGGRRRGHGHGKRGSQCSRLGARHDHAAGANPSHQKRGAEAEPSQEVACAHTPWGKQSPARFFAAGCSLLRRKPCGKGLGAGRLAGVVGETRGGQLGHHGRGWRTQGPRRSPAGGTTTHGLLPMWLNAARD
jgi:hypothetical protein